MSYLGNAVGDAAKSSCYLTAENPFDALKGEGAGTFDTLMEVLTPILKDTYVAVIIIGICLMIIAGVSAIVVLSLSKNDKKVAENKTWLMRIIFCVAGIGLFLSGTSLVWRTSQKVNSSLDGGTATPAAQVKEIPYHEVNGLF